MKIFDAILQLASNTTISLKAEGKPAAVALSILGAFLTGATAYGVHEYLDYKFKMNELEHKQILSTLDPGKDTQDKDDSEGNM